MEVFDICHQVGDEWDTAFCIDADSIKEAWQQMKKCLFGYVNEEEYSISVPNGDTYYLCQVEGE